MKCLLLQLCFQRRVSTNTVAIGSHARVCACACVCACVCTHAQVCRCAHVCTWVCVCMCVCMWVHMYVCWRVWACVHVCVCECRHACVSPCMCVGIRIWLSHYMVGESKERRWSVCRGRKVHTDCVSLGSWIWLAVPCSSSWLYIGCFVWVPA